MPRPRAQTTAVILVASVLLFLCYLPILNLLTGHVTLRWTGDLSSGRTPLIEHISWVYSEPGVLATSCVVAAVLLTELTVLMRSRGHGLFGASIILFLPFGLALLLQYCVWIALDDQLYWMIGSEHFPWSAQSYPWSYMLQPPLILECVGIAAGYCGLMVLIWFGANKARRLFHTSALTRRCS